MGILVKGMEMPETCNKCFFDHRKCEAHQRQVERIANSETEQIFDIFGETRVAGCPLVEVKPHGRLIDADELVGNISDTYCEECPKTKPIMCKACEYEDIMDDIENAPTVLEASE